MSSGSPTRIFARVVTIALGVTMSLVGVELMTRIIDGYSLTSWRLVRVRAPKSDRDVAADPYVAQIPVASGVDRDWFATDPPVASGGNQTPDPDLAGRFWSHKGFELPSVYEWNAAYLRAAACTDRPAVYRNVLDMVFPIGELFTFDPPAGDPYPTYRYLRNARYPTGLVTNAYGWRGPDTPLHRPDGTIRIAFVGASTTAAPHRYKYSYPDYVREWLDRWRTERHVPASFDVINAGREGINSTSIAAVVRDELAPLDPDVVVYYEGANQFGLSDYVQWPGGTFPVRPAHAGPSRLEETSAVAMRVRALRDPLEVQRGEPRKPQLPIAWPQDLDEQDPPLDHPRLTLELPTIMRDLDAIREVLGASGGRLAVSSFVWCVRDGMQLDPARDAGVYRQLNDMYWPFSYAYMRRMADFQNRVLAKYARARGSDFIDIAASYPLDPQLFIDAIHMTEAGTKLMAWIAFQRLVPVLDEAIRRRTLPRPARAQLSRHPAFEGSPRSLVSVASLRASCRN